MQAQVFKSAQSRRRVPTLPPELCVITILVATPMMTMLRHQVSTFTGDALQFIRVEPSEHAGHSSVVICVTKNIAEALTEHLMENISELQIGRRADVVLRANRRLR